MTEKERKVCMVDDIPNLESSELAMAYARARGADRVSSFGISCWLQIQLIIINLK